MKPVPHGEPYAGKLHVRFDEGADVPCGGVSPYSIPSNRSKRSPCRDALIAAIYGDTGCHTGLSQHTGLTTV